MHPIDPELLAGFVDEAKSYLPQIAAGIEAARRQAAARPGQVLAGHGSLGEAHRLAHSIKGAASMVGLPALGEMAGRLEERLETLENGESEVTGELAAALLAAVSEIATYLDGVSTAPSAVAPGPALSLAEVSPELAESFLDEAQDHLAAVADALAALRREPAAAHRAGGPLAEIRRSVHTLKGTSALVGATGVSRLAHRMEDLLDLLVDGEETIAAGDLDLLYATADALADLVVGGSETQAGTAELYARYRDRLGEGPAELPFLGERPDDAGAPGDGVGLAALGAGEPVQIAPGGRAPLRMTPIRVPPIRVSWDRLEELVRLVSELVVNRSTFEQYFGNLSREVGELDLSVARLRRIAGRLETGYEAAALGGRKPFLGGGRVWRGGQPLGAAAGALAWPAGGANGGAVAAGFANGADFDELELDRYTELHLITRELTETGSDIAALGGELSGTIVDFDGYLARLSRLTSEVQDGLLRLRMVPLGTLAARLERAVRVTAQAQGKTAELVLEGAGVELDKAVLEEIADPLLHLMRNAVDHGIEPPALRRAAGKPDRGRVRLSATHEGTQVVLTVEDDGAGLDAEAIREVAMTREYLGAEDVARLADDELAEMLFLPGFSTAGRVSEVSGRGVGLDVVKTTVERMKGSVALASRPGEGTTVSIRLPVSLAILKVLMVEAGGRRYAVPLAVVTQILRAGRRDLESVGQESVLRAGDEVLPVVHLAEALGWPEAAGWQDGAGDDGGALLPVLVIRLGGRKYALVVDSLLEAREVVVKGLGPHLKRVPGLTGATLMGDGSVVLILAPAELVERKARGAVRARPAALQPRWRGARALEVMIVDDSLSVRRVLSGLLRGAGFHPTTARDGLEALELLQHASQPPDVILLDIEMPRMDGYELVATLKGQPALAGIPVVMLTSRAGDKHRQRAFDLGVADYVVKPFQDEGLLATVRRLGAASRRGQLAVPAALGAAGA